MKRYVYAQAQYLIIIISAGILLTGTIPLKTMAQGNLLITPVRVVFEGQKKMQELNLANSGKDTAKYLVSLMEIRMNTDGTFERISQPDSGQAFASNNLRFFPRTVVLAPGEAQLVKIQLTRSSQLTMGEYRSHIYLRAVPDEKPLGDKMPPKDSSAISVKLIAIFGISIPVIIRIGQSTTKVSLSDLSLDTDSLHGINMLINRTGNFSSYGDVTVKYISPQGKVTKVGMVNGIAVYTPNIVRKFHVNLNTKPGFNYHKGKLLVEYSITTDGVVTPVLLAQAELLLH
ncbi:hypothetical protein SAMN05518672_103224 [Chitinophaga sp. CF118]|uniref:hypothetical protein n=1 Tax=Chitinophaga sp. CF118 TaxID=1884367 RepID=UPI0008EAC6C3|nr:hypothetical protein [Chitinophaga sp. CF118]SFD78932.1 hypothetical protein SAMN05518672_103224 [Chitinophaga sp. CF118]